MSSGSPGRIRISPNFISSTWAFHEAYSMAEAQAPEVKKETAGISNFTKTSLLQLIITSITAQTGRFRSGFLNRDDRKDSMSWLICWWRRWKGFGPDPGPGPAAVDGGGGGGEEASISAIWIKGLWRREEGTEEERSEEMMRVVFCKREEVRRYLGAKEGIRGEGVLLVGVANGLEG
ncbi:hypothetical protein F0562_011919 [Nyssa sinensis]|uniref:Uncharacterized protein n=1 Tax=Nyssa sinensis TaxID=561372 RepID=A0A5J4ZTR0_9ASTE|nr:hypothetical protein F0562_011919 [Nyssa sinensis]